jgi:predicted nuclease of restriction endonuclease-like (RecB) superfamily
MNMKTKYPALFDNLYHDVCSIIEDAREQAYRAVNVSLTLRNWMLGERIAREKLDGEERAEYGKQVITNLAKELTSKYGKGFERVSLYNYLKFYRCFPEIVDAVSQQLGNVDAVSGQLGNVDAVSGQSEILHAVSAKSKLPLPLSGRILPWTHYRELIRVEDPVARKWYEQEALKEVWGTRTLHRNIASQYYNRLLQSAHKEKVVEEMHKLTAPMQQDKLEFIKNPVVAKFLGLQSNADFTESELEGSIINHLQKFIMEMGKGFAFVGRQQHIRTDMGDFYIDLVFYNYILKCFFLIDLKTTQISHQDVGQMDMYIRMYDSLKRTEGDNPTIGLLLCSDTSDDMARYSVLHGSDQIFQAKYLTYLPSKEELAHEIEIQKEIFRQQQANKD